ncbi:PEP/pyruvate-binding domain-containing protein [Thermodesulfobacteriota bacterium]
MFEERERLMDYVLDLTTITSGDAERVGEKGARLGELLGRGFNVPAGFCVTARACEYFIAENGGIGRALASLVEEGRVGSEAGPDGDLERIRCLFREARFPAGLRDAILAGYDALNGKGASRETPVAVRSSCTTEDLPGASFAGQYHSFLCVRGREALLERVKLTWASQWGRSISAYRTACQCDFGDSRMAILVQDMIPSEFSGVIFTANPVSSDAGQMVINASWGLGESIVSGIVSPDTYVVEKGSFEVLEREISDKRLEVVDRPSGESGTVTVEVEPEKASESTLMTADVIELCALGLEIEEVYGFPQDIEWSSYGGEFYVLQSRPITTLK